MSPWSHTGTTNETLLNSSRFFHWHLNQSSSSFICLYFHHKLKESLSEYESHRVRLQDFFFGETRVPTAERHDTEVNGGSDCFCPGHSSAAFPRIQSPPTPPRHTKWESQTLPNAGHKGRTKPDHQKAHLPSYSLSTIPLANLVKYPLLRDSWLTLLPFFIRCLLWQLDKLPNCVTSSWVAIFCRCYCYHQLAAVL